MRPFSTSSTGRCVSLASHAVALIVLVATGMLVETETVRAQNCSACVYSNTPDAGPANVATPIPGGSSIAIGANAQSSSPSGSGDSIAIGAGVTASGQDSIAIGANTYATSSNTLAIGNNGTIANADGATAIGQSASASSVGSVAVGIGSQALRAGLSGGREDFSNVAVSSTFGEFSVGQAGFERQVTNVAGGTEDTDAVNVRQLRAVADALGGSLGGSVDGNGLYTAPIYSVGGTSYASLSDAMAASDRLSVQYTPDVAGNATNAVDLTRGGTLSAVALTGLADGAVSAGSTDAVTGGQLRQTGQSIAGALGGGSAVNPDGTVSAPSYGVQGTAYSDVGAAIGGLDSAIAQIQTTGTRYVAVHSSGAAADAAGADSVAVGAGAIASQAGSTAVGTGSIADRAGMDGAHEAFSDVAIASTNGALSVGSEGGERQITNVAGGTAETDAVNVRQLRAVGKGLAETLGGGAGVNEDSTLRPPSYEIGGERYGTVGDALTAMAALDGEKLGYDRDPETGARGNSVTLQGGDASAPVTVRNVADGVEATDAANLRQVSQAETRARHYTDTRLVALGSEVAELRQDIGDVRREARQAAAIGLASGAMRFDDRPGKLSVATGSGLWKNETALAVGVGYTMPENNVKLSAFGVTSGGDFGGGAGVSFTLN